MKRSSLYSPEHRVLVMLLRDLRLEAGLSQLQVAEAIERPQPHVSAIEIGRRGLDLLQVRELAELYGVDLVRFSALFEERLQATPYRPPRRVRKDARETKTPKAHVASKKRIAAAKPKRK